MTPSTGTTTTTLGTNVRAERQARNLTAEKLGEMTGLAPTTITGIERGKAPNPGAFTLYKIAAALGVRLETLMGVERVERLTTGRSNARTPRVGAE